MKKVYKVINYTWTTPLSGVYGADSTIYWEIGKTYKHPENRRGYKLCSPNVIHCFTSKKLCKNWFGSKDVEDRNCIVIEAETPLIINKDRDKAGVWELTPIRVVPLEEYKKWR